LINTAARRLDVNVNEDVRREHATALCKPATGARDGTEPARAFGPRCLGLKMLRRPGPHVTIHVLLRTRKMQTRSAHACMRVCTRKQSTSLGPLDIARTRAAALRRSSKQTRGQRLLSVAGAGPVAAPALAAATTRSRLDRNTAARPAWLVCSSATRRAPRAH